MTKINGTNVSAEYDSGDEVSLGSVLPRVLVVSRRTVRKNKFVDFVGEYHLDLVLSYGAVPVIVPRVSGLHSLLDSFEPIHGVLLCEGEDIDPSLYESDLSHLSPDEMAKIKKAHSSDTQIDKDKDSIELQLARRCLERNIPYLGICRGSQVLNVACGGSLYQDVETELSSKKGVEVRHIDYENYDGHRHPVTVVEGTPLHEWFAVSLEKSSTGSELIVNSYHHQGVKRLATRFQPMAHAPDGLIEAFYDPAVCNPEEGKFIVGLQFHPERMRHEHDSPIESQTTENLMQESTFDYPECPRIYQEFGKAVVAYQKRLLSSGKEKLNRKIDAASMERQIKKLVRSFSLAKIIYEEEHLRSPHSVHGAQKALAALRHPAVPSPSDQELEFGARFLQAAVGCAIAMCFKDIRLSIMACKFMGYKILNRIPCLQSNTALNSKQVKFLHEMGATVRNSSLFLEKMQLNERKEAEARKMMEDMHEQELQEFIDFYRMLVDAASSVLQQKRTSSFNTNF